MRHIRSWLTILPAILCLFIYSNSHSAANKNARAGKLEIIKITEQPQKLTIDATTIKPVLRTRGNKSSVPALRTEILQGGDNIATAVEIVSTPFSGSGTTLGYTDDYDEACTFPSTSPDVVYKYSPPEKQVVDILLCGSDYSTHLWVYENDEFNPIACNRFDVVCGQLLQSALFDVEMNVGNTYYIVIDGEAGQSGDYVIDMTAEPAPPSYTLHPALGDNGSGAFVLGYEFYGIDSGLFWQGSTDNGFSFTDAVGWNFEVVPEFPEIEYWGSGTRFYGTFKAPYQSIDSAAPTYLLQVGNPSDIYTYSLSYWDWSEVDWHDMKDVSIACDDGLAIWQWGMLSFVHSSHYPERTGGDPLIDAPHISYPSNDAGQAQISWFEGANGCNSTDAEIDRVTHKTYAAYDVYDTDSSQWVLFLRQDFSDDWDVPANAWAYTVGSVMEHLQFPTVAAYDGNFIMLAEYWNENLGSDRDIYVFRTSDSDMITMTDAVFEGTTDSERYPDISHVTGMTFIATFVRNDSVLFKYTDDAGATWSDAAAFNPLNQAVVSEDAYSHVGDGGGNIIWEYQLAGDPSVYLNWTSTGILDSDTDGYIDLLDNCPSDYNPLQTDTDSDGIGDACCCVGIRGNANGDLEDKVNIADVTFIVQYLFGIPSGDAPGCPTEANANHDLEEKTNIADITFLTTYLFGIPSGPEPTPCP